MAWATCVCARPPSPISPRTTNVTAGRCGSRGCRSGPSTSGASGCTQPVTHQKMKQHSPTEKPSRVCTLSPSWPSGTPAAPCGVRLQALCARIHATALAWHSCSKDKRTPPVFHGHQRPICVGGLAHSGVCHKAEKARERCEGSNVCMMGIARLHCGHVVGQVQGCHVSRTEVPKPPYDA